MKKILHAKDAPDAIGTYSQAIETKSMIFTSGQIGIDPNTGELISTSIKDQIKQTLKNLDAILVGAGLSKDSIVKLTVYLKDFNDFSTINNAFKLFFNNNEFPARSTIEVSKLPMGASVEIDCIATKE